ncbi:MAG: DUF5667 domain-containing protein [Chloroflexota bacterium]|nr:DUF5667 domain-containing protein [Chloroflexota bacterium]
MTLYPARRRELEPLLSLVVRLQAAHTLNAPPEFRRTAAVRMRNLVATRPRGVEQTVKKINLLRDVHQKLRLVSLPLGTHRRSLATTVIGVLIAILLLASGGVVYASADTLPGDVLYPIKIVVEDVQLAVSLNDAGDAELRLAFATRRLAEAAVLLEDDRPEDIEQALTNYTIQIESVLNLFYKDSPLPSDERAVLANLMVMNLTRHEARLTALSDQVPEASRPAVELALAAYQAALKRALEEVDGRPGRGTPKPPATPGRPPTPTPSPEPLTPTPIPTPTFTPTIIPILTTQSPVPIPSPEWLTPERPPSGWPTPELPPDLPTPELPPDLPTPGLPPDLPTPGFPPDLPTPGFPPDLPTPGFPPGLPTPGFPPDLPTPGLPPGLPTPPAWPTP